MNKIAETNLILNADGSIYHLGLMPGELAETIFLVGDPDRVPKVSKYFDSIEIKKQKRELITHTGYVNKKRVSVVSTGMSTDNIDIVLNEIDALFNIDFAERTIKEKLTSVRLVRLGTSGGLQADIPLDSVVVSHFSVGFDGLLPFYERQITTVEDDLLRAANYALGASFPAVFYAAEGDHNLVTLFSKHCQSGITATCGGFYAPQGRILRAKGSVDELVEKLQQFKFQEHRFVNFEMETAAIYGLGKILGHQCCSLNAIVANRVTQKFSTDFANTIDKMIKNAIEVLL